MKDYIQEKLVEMHRTATTDKFGQIGKSNFGLNSLFGERAEEVKAYADANPNVIRVSTYGASYGTYKAVDIVDAEIRQACSEALKKNENYRRNMTGW